jgi:cytochrome c oxidase assembly factor CtaG
LGHAWLARASQDATTRHTFYFLSGLVALWVALESPIDTISDRYLDSVHMLQHVLLGFVAPPLVLLGLSPRMAGRLMRVPLFRAVTEPVPAQVIGGAVMILWHIPALYDSTLRSEDLHIVEHITFIGAGVVLYWPVLKDTSAHARWEMSSGVKLLYLLVATIPQDGVALALLFSREPFYEYYVRVPRLIDSLTPLVDQTLAGAVLMVLGKTTMLVSGLAIFFRWFGREHRADQAGLVAP